MFKILTMQKLIFLNQYVQEIVRLQEVLDWFIFLDESTKQSVVKEVWILATQAQIQESMLFEATKKANLKETHTPVVMLTKSKLPLYARGYELANLNGTVLNQAFMLVLECFALAERSRREKEKTSECTHWWHRDLSDERIVKEILNEY